ncbi:MAG: ferritin [Candidatus Omnitrophica bacterium]|nr:ferritin [Candidatus Omnitrophota bacterium]
MIGDKMAKSISQQITRELYSAYLYVGMSAYADGIGLKGVANWFFVQMQEEMVHAYKFYAYVNQQGGKVSLGGIDKPTQDFTSVKDAFKKTLEHERTVTANINQLMAQAKEEKDAATEILLQWYVTEQIEEEANPTEILQKLNLAGEGNGLFLIDAELAKRTFVVPAGVQVGYAPAAVA